MTLYSTGNKQLKVSWKQAILAGLSPDGGLYMPECIPSFPGEDFRKLKNLSFPELAAHIAAKFMGDEITLEQLNAIAAESLDIPLPLKNLTDNTYILELFHGPTCAFKDFGARFMSHLFRHFWGKHSEPLTVVTATSGDTGSAVAHAFYDQSESPRIRVAILYPKDKVSPIQRKQMTTLGHNITAYEVDGTFDDCQALAKQALADTELQKKMCLTSANSINIARLLPQMFYYAYTSLLVEDSLAPLFIVPSGNLGNVVGSLFAKAMGFRIEHSIAACNANKTFVDFLEGNPFTPTPSLQTISNAMDVGNPSNIHRLIALQEQCNIKKHQAVSAISIRDDETKEAMQELFSKYHYIADPHTAVAASLITTQRIPASLKEHPKVVVATAHPAKFGDTVEQTIGLTPDLPRQLLHTQELEEYRHSLNNSYTDFISALKANH
jgi:threonine synthase